MFVLIADPDPTNRERLAECFGQRGCDVLSVSDWSPDNARHGMSQAPDLVLVDLAALHGDPYTALERLRDQDPMVAILAYGQHAESGAAVRSLSAGADDYLNMPIDLAELEARAHAVLRRSHILDAGQSICAGPLHIDDRAKQVTVAGEPVNLSPKEYQLLRLCAREPGKVFSHEEIVACLWPGRSRGGAADVKQYIHLLRSKLAKTTIGRDLIENVKGFGYRLAVPDSGNA